MAKAKKKKKEQSIESVAVADLPDLAAAPSEIDAAEKPASRPKVLRRVKKAAAAAARAAAQLAEATDELERLLKDLPQKNGR